MEKGVRDFWPKQLQKACAFQLCNWFSPSQKISIVYTLGLHSLCCQIQSEWNTSSKKTPKETTKETTKSKIFMAADRTMHSRVPKEHNKFVSVYENVNDLVSALTSGRFFSKNSPKSTIWKFKGMLGFFPDSLISRLLCSSSRFLWLPLLSNNSHYSVTFVKLS